MRKRNKIVIGIAILFLLLINTIGIWGDNLSFYAMVISAVLVLTFIGLSIIFIIQLYFCIRSKFIDSERNLSTVVLLMVLVSTFIAPLGFINYNNMGSKDILVAHREGVANCSATLRLKENNKFTFNNVCFGTSMTKGEFILIGDTVYFKNVELGRSTKSFFEYGILNKFNENRLILHANRQDSVGLTLKLLTN